MTVATSAVGRVGWAARALVIVLCALIIASIVSYSARERIDFPYGDMWDVPMIIALNVREGREWLPDLFMQANKHRIFASQLTTAVLAAVSAWHIPSEVYVNLVLAGINLALLLWFARRADERRWWWLALPLTALVFTWRIKFMWVINYNHNFYALLFLLAALAWVSAREIGWRGLLGAAVIAAIANFSFGFGFVLWVALAAALWLRGYRGLRYYLAWLVCAAGTIALYYTNYEFIDTQGSVLPLDVIQFGLSFLGGLFAFPADERTFNPVTMLYGGLGLGLYALNVLVLWRRGLLMARGWQWVIIGLFALGCAGITALGRVGSESLFGLELAVNVRYVIVSSMLWASVLVLTFINLIDITAAGRPYWRMAWTLAAAALVGFGIWFGAVTTATAQATLPDFDLMRRCIVSYTVTKDANCFTAVSHFFSARFADQRQGLANFPHLERLIANRMTLFAYVEPGSLLPNGVLMQRGIEARRNNDLVGALAFFSAALQARPNNADALNRRGDIYYSLREFDWALSDFTRAINASSQPNTFALVKRGSVYIDLGRLDEAQADFEAVLAVQPEDATARAGLERLAAARRAIRP